jgi:hypothetical protein
MSLMPVSCFIFSYGKVTIFSLTLSGTAILKSSVGDIRHPRVMLIYIPVIGQHQQIRSRKCSDM